MSRWQEITLKFDPLGSLRPPLESALEAIRAIEAILEALLDLIKIFSLDLLNPLRAIVALLLAAVRAIINQLSSTGISLLVVHPDFTRDGLPAILESVSGAYPRFESKVIGKFFDTNDIYRPTYPSGSSVAMAVFYIGADSAGDLLKILMSLMRFFSTPLAFSIPPPVNLKVTPVTKGGDPVAQFERLFDSDLQKALSLEWRTPIPYTGLGAPGVFNQFSSFLRSFETPNFIVERSLTPGGKTIERRISNSTIGHSLNQRIADTVDFVVDNKIALREIVPGAPMFRGPVYHHFEKRFDVSGARLLAGTLTGVFRYLDDGDDLEPGQTWTYRVRSYFGDASVYINDISNNENLLSSDAIDFTRTDILRTNGQDWLVLTSNGGYVISQPSATVQAIVPEVSSAANATHIYYAIFDAIRAAILLNFEMPLPSRTSPDYERSPRNRPSYTRNEQRTGWGTLNIVAGHFIPLKKAYNDAEKLKNSILFNQICRTIANKCLVDIYNKPEIGILLSEKWTGPNVTPLIGTHVSAADKLDLPPDAIKPIVQKILHEVRNEDGDATKFVGEPVWSFLSLSVTGTISKLDENKINNYLAKEDTYVVSNGVVVGDQGLTKNNAPLLGGPAPLTFVTAEERSALAEFLRIALIPMSGDMGYLVWRGVTLGDLFPYFIPFIFDFEQFLKGLLQAFENAVKEIQAIIENLIQRIRLLEQILESILQLINMLKISVRVSILGTSTTNGSAMGLINNLLTAVDKPGDSPFGLHSGIVLTVGGPGAGFIKAIEAIMFIVGGGPLGV